MTFHLALKNLPISIGIQTTPETTSSNHPTNKMPSACSNY